MPTKTAAANKSEKSPKYEKSAATNGASFSKETYLRTASLPDIVTIATRWY